jgi:hypothetical protein
MCCTLNTTVSWSLAMMQWGTGWEAREIVLPCRNGTKTKEGTIVEVSLDRLAIGECPEVFFFVSHWWSLEGGRGVRHSDCIVPISAARQIWLHVPDEPPTEK